MGTKGLRIQEKAANGFHRWPFSHNGKAPQAALELCGSLRVLGQGGRTALGALLLSSCGTASGARAQQEARKIGKMRSLRGGRVGCDTGEERGAGGTRSYCNLAEQGKAAVGMAGHLLLQAGARDLASLRSQSACRRGEGRGWWWRPGGILWQEHGRSFSPHCTSPAGGKLSRYRRSQLGHTGTAGKHLENTWHNAGNAPSMDVPCVQRRPPGAQGIHCDRPRFGGAQSLSLIPPPLEPPSFPAVPGWQRVTLGSPSVTPGWQEVPLLRVAPALEGAAPFPRCARRGCSPRAPPGPCWPRGGRGRGGGAPDFVSARGLPVPARRCRRQSKERLFGCRGCSALTALLCSR